MCKHDAQPHNGLCSVFQSRVGLRLLLMSAGSMYVLRRYESTVLCANQNDSGTAKNGTKG